MQGTPIKICPHCKAQNVVSAPNYWQCFRTFQTQWVNVDQTQAFGPTGFPLTAKTPVWKRWWFWVFLVSPSFFCLGFMWLYALGSFQMAYDNASDQNIRNEVSEDRSYYLGEWEQTNARGEVSPFTFTDEEAVCGSTHYSWGTEPGQLWFVPTYGGQGRIEDMVTYTVRKNSEGFTAVDETGHLFTYRRLR